MFEGKGPSSRRLVKLCLEGVDLIGLEDEVEVEEGCRMTNKQENTLVIKQVCNAICVKDMAIS